jgi:hypothetical protein
MNRRALFKMASLLGASKMAGALTPSLHSATAAKTSCKQKSKAPFKVMYSNDATNMLECVSPYHPSAPYDFDVNRLDDQYEKKVGPLTDDMIRASVDEAAGADAQFLQPGYGWLAWWKSKVHPAANDYKWIQEQTGVPPDAFGRYVLSGGDMVKVFVDRCHERGKAAFVSLRLNDPQTISFGPKDPYSVFVSRFYMEHPEYWLDKNSSKRDDRCQNWAIPEVRDYKFSFIKELCENYDLDGFELDFMRNPCYFHLNETTVEQRVKIMTDFMARVRRLLDETARGGRHRWLCARVPCFVDAFDPIGMDLQAMVDAGMEMVNVSASYFTVQQTNLPIMRKIVPDASIYLEMTHTTLTGPPIPASWDSAPFLRTTDQQFYTAANLAYARGADGVSFFNFFYYREFGHAIKERGPFNEPPFHVMKHLGDTAWLREQQQWYLLSKGGNNPTLLGDTPLPKIFHPRERHIFMLDMAPNERNKKALLRLRAVQSAQGRTWNATLNGVKLEPTSYIAKPIDHPYNAYLGESGQYACFTCPPDSIRDGKNQLILILENGEPVTIEYLDLVLNV